MNSIEGDSDSSTGSIASLESRHGRGRASTFSCSTNPPSSSSSMGPLSGSGSGVSSEFNSPAGGGENTTSLAESEIDASEPGALAGEKPRPRSTVGWSRRRSSASNAVCASERRDARRVYSSDSPGSKSFLSSVGCSIDGSLMSSCSDAKDAGVSDAALLRDGRHDRARLAEHRLFVGPCELLRLRGRDLALGLRLRLGRDRREIGRDARWGRRRMLVDSTLNSAGIGDVACVSAAGFARRARSNPRRRSGFERTEDASRHFTAPRAAPDTPFAPALAR